MDITGSGKLFLKIKKYIKHETSYLRNKPLKSSRKPFKSPVPPETACWKIRIHELRLKYSFDKKTVLILNRFEKILDIAHSF